MSQVIESVASAGRRLPRAISSLMVGTILALVIVATPAAAAGCPNESLRVGPSADLPNCRAYEQVTPTQKNGQVTLNTGVPSRATADGNALGYASNGRYANSPSGAFPNLYVARRSSTGGWGVANVSPPSTPVPTPPGGAVASYEFSPDLSESVLKLPLAPLAPGADPTVLNLFLRDSIGNYSLINTDPPPVKLPGECPVPSLEVACWQFVDVVTFAGATPDFRHMLIQVRKNLADFEGHEELFRSDFEGGSWHMSSVGVLPDGLAAPEGSTAGSGSSIFASTSSPDLYNRVANAISPDGSRVIFQANSDEGELNEAGQLGLTQVYDRLGGTATVEISAPAVGSTPAHPGAGAATFWAGSVSGDRVFFTSSAELTTASNTGPSHEGADLYEYDFARNGDELHDLTTDTGVEAGAQVLGVLDASEDGSYVYFVARAQLDGSKGVAGEPNLYVSHEGDAPSFVATLSESDAQDWTQSAALRESYVTPDGRHAAFTSINPVPAVNFPTGYNNVNETTSTPEREVYVYSVGGGLFCASCNRSGAAPVGPGLLGGVHRPGTTDVSQSSAFHPVRAVSNDGSRVFFSSQDPLVGETDPADTNAKIYQWEAPTEGSCSAGGGCVNLLSGSNPPNESVFLGASSDGADVFFATTEQLLPSDKDELSDIYDARIGGGFTQEEPAPECTSDKECRSASQALPGYSPPATPNFQGPGNTKPRQCSHGKVKRHGKCVKKKTGSKKHRKKGSKKHRHGAKKGHGKKHGGQG
jgi:hypothetical protein